MADPRSRGVRYTSALAVLLAAAAGSGLAAPAVAAAQQECRTTSSTPGQRITATPWAQQRFGPDRISRIADGRDVIVAVIDSGVDADHEQLRGHVLKGRDFLDPSGDGRRDCVGHGTGVASIIAAQKQQGVPFHGLARGVKILPVRVSEVQDLGDGRASGDSVGPDQVAEAITWAVRQGAKVINLSLIYSRDYPPLAAAVADAVAADVVVVAAVGNHATEGNPTPYPAAYEGVLGVGAIQPDGTRMPQSQIGDYVDVVAPGVGIVMAANGGLHREQNGTSFAAPYVAATAALLRQTRSLKAPEVIRRIEATADLAPGGQDSNAYGHGVVNPYRAVTESVAQAPPERATPLPAATVDPAVVAAQQRQAQTRRLALWLAAAGAVVAAVALLCATVIPRGVRRRWRPAA